MSTVETIGFITGAVCVWLAVRQNVWNFPVGIANNAFFFVLFLQSGLYAGAGLQIVFLALAASGWYWWLRGGEGRTPLTIRPTARWMWAGAAVLSVVLTATLTAVLTRWTDSEVAVWDALTTATSIVAQILLNRKIIGTWAVWILTDIVLIGLYAHQELWLTAALYVGFLAMCVTGLRAWRAALRGSEESQLVTV